MRRFFPVEELARDERFNKITMRDRMADPRTAMIGPRDGSRPSSNRLVLVAPGASDAARALMHGIFVGEIQPSRAPAGRASTSRRRRRRSPQARHGPSVLGRGASCRDQRQAGRLDGERDRPVRREHRAVRGRCNADPVLRLAGVNRALEGLAIDVFTTMKDFGDVAGDPYLEFCEDWMLADEVTHVKMGSDWLRRVTEGDPERRTKALEFQGIVDKLFSYGGARSDSDESPIGLARRFRELAGFSDDEIDEIADVSPRRPSASASSRPPGCRPRLRPSSRVRERAGARMSWGGQGPAD